MKTEIHIQGRPVNVCISNSALAIISQRLEPLFVEMELYFSCLIRKKVRFHEKLTQQEAVFVIDNLSVTFRPVMTASCAKDYEGDEPPLTDFPVVRQNSFIPHWLTIDYRQGEWIGEFGY